MYLDTKSAICSSVMPVLPAARMRCSAWSLQPNTHCNRQQAHGQQAGQDRQVRPQAVNPGVRFQNSLSRVGLKACLPVNMQTERKAGHPCESPQLHPLPHCLATPATKPAPSALQACSRLRFCNAGIHRATLGLLVPAQLHHMLPASQVLLSTTTTTTPYPPATPSPTPHATPCCKHTPTCGSAMRMTSHASTRLSQASW